MSLPSISMDPVTLPRHRIGLPWRIALTSLVVVVMVAPAHYIQMQQPWGAPNPIYRISETRECTSSSERDALKMAERLDLATVVGTFRFYNRYSWTNGSNDTPIDLDQRPRPHLVDSMSMSAARAWVEHCRDSRVQVSTGYRYEAECIFRISFEMVAQPINITIPRRGPDGLTVFRYVDPTGLGLHEGMYNISNVYWIEQSIEVSSIVGPLAGSGYDVVQTIIMDSEMHLRYLEVTIYQWLA